jgi:chloride channel protein, CIC family
VSEPGDPTGHYNTEKFSENPRPLQLGDFTVGPRVLWITLLAIPIGAGGACFALILLRLIAFFTNLSYYGRISLATVSPAGHHLGWLAVFVPVLGAIVVGYMARYGSERIRGHGIPEAIESILLSGSRIEPRVAILKPLSAAVAIGTGGPFGAEGPIIMTGGSFGSMVAQMFHLTSAERKTLLVAGAAAGMSATFAAPIASVLLAIELLLFERKPRSIIPVAMASGTAALLRHFLLGDGPLFPAHPHPAVFSPVVLLLCIVAGIVCGFVAIPLSDSVYKVEDTFAKLPVHWMWWPAIGGVVVGLGGLIFPPALGVGYDVIGRLVQGEHGLHLVFGVLIVKWVIWAVDLGSGTSGGVLAPVMMIGGALGALLGYVLPDMGPGFWVMIGIAGILSGTLRVPMTAIIFTIEETHDWNMFLPLLLGSVAAYAVSTMLLRRSILTEKVARRGYHLSCEYSIDPMEMLYVREVMRPDVETLQANASIGSSQHALEDYELQKQRLLPVVRSDGTLLGVLTRGDVRTRREQEGDSLLQRKVEEVTRREAEVAFPDEPLRAVVYRMAETGMTRLPVIERETRKFLGLISLDDLLKARTRHLEEERRREQLLNLWSLLPGNGGGKTGTSATG